MSVPGVRSVRRASGLAAAALLLAGCTSVAPATVPATPSASAPATVAPSAATSATLPPPIQISSTNALRISSGLQDWVTLANGYAWTESDTAVMSWDIKSGAVGIVATGIHKPCEAMAVGFGTVWVIDCGATPPALVSIGSGGISGTKALPGPIPDTEGSIAIDDTAIYVLVGSKRTLVKLDRTGVILAQTPVPGVPTAIRAGFGSIWAVSPIEDKVLRIDPSTGAVLATIDLPGGSRPAFLATGLGGVWTLDQTSGTVTRIDPASNAIVARIQLGETDIDGGDITVGGGSVWAHGFHTLAWRIDPATNAVVASYVTDPSSGGIAADDDAVWITTEGPGTMWRLPLR